MARSPTILVVGINKPDPAQNTYGQFADVIRDVNLSNLSAADMAAIRADNPDVVILAAHLPGGTQNSSEYPVGYYVYDPVTGQRIVNQIGWFLLDFSQVVVRTARRDKIAEAVVTRGYDGYVTDMAQPLWRWTNDFGSSFWRSGTTTGPVATFPAGWVGAAGLWATTYMLNWHKEMKADSRVANKYRFVDGYPSALSIYNTPGLPARITEYIAENLGAFSEVSWIRTSGWLSETDWVHELQRFKETLDAGKIICTQLPGEHFPAAPTLQQKRFCFASYLLIADGQKAWFWLRDPQTSSTKMRWDSDYQTLIDVDYGMPDASVNGGVYQVLAASPSGNIYKRTLTKARVWVNPSGTARTADGKTVPAHDAIIEMRADPITVPGAPTLALGTPTATTIPATIGAGSPAGDTYELRYWRDIEVEPSTQQITGLPTGPRTIGAGAEGPLESGRLYSVKPFARIGTNLTVGPVRQATTAGGPPIPPTNPTLGSPTESSLEITATDQAGNEDSFEVEVRVPPAAFTGTPTHTGIPSVAGVGGGVRTTLGGLVVNTPYRAQIRAKSNSAGAGPWSAESNQISTSPTPTPPPTPNNPAIAATGYNSVRCSCDDVAGETGYKWEVSKNGGAFIQKGTTGAGVVVFDYVDPTPGAGENIYQMRVRATNATGDSAYATSGTVRTPPLTLPRTARTEMAVLWGRAFDEDFSYIPDSGDEARRLIELAVVPAPSWFGNRLYVLRVQTLSALSGAADRAARQTLANLTEFTHWCEFGFDNGFAAPAGSFISLIQYRKFSTGKRWLAIRIDETTNILKALVDTTTGTNVYALATGPALAVRHTLKAHVKKVGVGADIFQVWLDGVLVVDVATLTIDADVVDEVRIGAASVPAGWSSAPYYIGRMLMRNPDFTGPAKSSAYDYGGFPEEPSSDQFQSSPSYQASPLWENVS